MQLMQRPGNQFNKDYIDNYIRLIRENPGSCDNVWLSTSYGFPPLEKHREFADFWKEAAKKFREAGISVSLQISNSIGHGMNVAGRDNAGLVFEGSPARNAVGPDGVSCPFAWCWRGEFMLDYLCEYLSYYAEIMPDVVWLDDDFRPESHGDVDLCCFCDDCIATFNKRHGVYFTRDELVEHIIHDESLKWREKWIAFSRESASNMIRRISEAIYKVSPDTTMALQHGPLSAYLGFGYDYIFEPMYEVTGKVPMSRPGGGAYDEIDPNGFLEKANLLSWQNSKLPDYVKVKCPEIENLPHVVYGKSSAGTAFETSLYFAAGNTDMSYSMMMETPEPWEFYRETFRLFAKHRSYWDKMSEYNKISHQGGIHLFTSRDCCKKKLTAEQDIGKYVCEHYSGPTVLMRDGVPLSYDRNEMPLVILHPETALDISKEEFEVLLAKNVIACGETIQILKNRGMDLGIDVRQIPDSDFRLMTEHYTDHPTKPANHDLHQSSYYTKGRSQIQLIMPGENVEPLSVYKKLGASAVPYFEDETYPYGIASAIITTPAGAKWFIDGYHMWKRVIPTYKRERLLDIADFISGNALPARMVTSMPAVLYPRCNDAGETVAVSVVNMTVGKSGEVWVRIRRPAGTHFSYMTQHNSEGKCKIRLDGDDILAKIPDIDAYSTATIFVEE